MLNMCFDLCSKILNAILHQVSVYHVGFTKIVEYCWEEHSWI